jgi:hypothetical protein
MQNPEENLYNLLITSTFDELAIQEREFVLCYLTETEYRNYTAVLQKLNSTFTTPLIETDLSFKQALDERLSALNNSPKKLFPFYKIAACIAFFMLLIFVYIKNSQHSQVNDKSIAQQQGILERKTVPVQNIPKNLKTVEVDKSIVKKENKRKPQILNPKPSTIQNEMIKEELMKISSSDARLATDIGLKSLSPLCSNPEDTEANDIAAQMLRL